ncbi:hypothetical protein EBT16_00005, partial [bacterium]|nr:hypothetical protein [bacterium]
TRKFPGGFLLKTLRLSRTVDDEVRKRVLAEGGAVSALHGSDLALVEGTDSGVLEAGANRVAPPEDITLHNIALVLHDGNRRADGLAVSPLVEELPHGEVSDETVIAIRHFELLSLSSGVCADSINFSLLVNSVF